MATFDSQEAMFMHCMEHRLLFDMIVHKPWAEDRDAMLGRAAEHAAAITGLDSTVIMGPGFKETVCCLAQLSGFLSDNPYTRSSPRYRTFGETQPSESKTLSRINTVSLRT